MIKLKLLLLTMILLGPCALHYARHRQPLGKTLPAALCSCSVALIFLGYVMPFSIAIAAVAAVSGTMWLYALIRMRQWKIPVIPLAIPAAVFFCSAVFLYDACAPRLFLSYDEFSHWGMIVKAISLFNGLPESGAGAAYIQYTYPPAAAMLPALATSILGYRDGIAYLGYALLLEGLLWGIASRVSRGWRVPAVCALLYLCVMAVFPMSILRLFIEPAAALLMVLMILDAYDEQEQSVFITALYAVMLAMLKNTGMVFVAIALIIRLFARTDKREAMRAFGIFAVCLLALASYRIYCHAEGIEAVISPSHLRENIAALFAGTLDEAYVQLPVRFIRFIFGEKLPQSGIYSSYGFGTCAQVMGVMLALCAAHVFIARDKKRAARLWKGVWLCNLLYLIMIAVSYLIGFEIEEVRRLAEADRYVSIVPLWTGVLAIALLALERDTPRRASRYALLALAAVVLTPLSHPEMTVKTFITREYVQNTEWARSETAKLAAFIRSEMPEEGGRSLLCIGDYNYIELHFELAGDVDIGRMDRNTEAWRGGSAELAAQIERTGAVCVFVGGLAEDAPRFADLTDNGEQICAYSLYDVKRGPGGEVMLCRMATMSDIESDIGV